MGKQMTIFDYSKICANCEHYARVYKAFYHSCFCYDSPFSGKVMLARDADNTCEFWEERQEPDEAYDGGEAKDDY